MPKNIKNNVAKEALVAPGAKPKKKKAMPVISTEEKETVKKSAPVKLLSNSDASREAENHKVNVYDGFVGSVWRSKEIDDLVAVVSVLAEGDKPVVVYSLVEDAEKPAGWDWFTSEGVEEVPPLDPDDFTPWLTINGVDGEIPDEYKQQCRDVQDWIEGRVANKTLGADEVTQFCEVALSCVQKIPQEEIEKLSPAVAESMKNLDCSTATTILSGALKKFAPKKEKRNDVPKPKSSRARPQK